jgi:hypothetical protein
MEEAITKMIKTGEDTIEYDMINDLVSELSIVLDNLAPLLTSIETHKYDYTNDKKIDILNILENMLNNHNPECINLLDNLKSIEGTEEIIKYIEEFEFIKAMSVLESLKSKILSAD